MGQISRLLWFWGYNTQRDGWLRTAVLKLFRIFLLRNSFPTCSDYVSTHTRVDGSMAWECFLGKTCRKQIPGLMDHVVHIFALKQNQCVGFVILSGK